MNYGEHGVEMNDVELKCIDAADAGENFRAFLMGACAAALSPLLGTVAEITNPGSAEKLFKDIFSGKYL